MSTTAAAALTPGASEAPAAGLEGRLVGQAGSDATDVGVVDTAPAPEPGQVYYDERGNVCPHYAEGARPLTFKQRVQIARRLARQ